MKYFLLIAALSLLSCEKMTKTCWECQLTGVSGYSAKIQVCNDGETPTGFTEPDGSDVNSHCVKR